MRLFGLILFLVSNISLSQEIDYKIYQFKENDSINGHISKIVKFNEQGLVIYKEYIDFLETGVKGKVDHRVVFFYKNNLLTEELRTYGGSDYKFKIEYKYNSNRQLVKEIHKSYLQKQKKWSWVVVSKTEHKYNTKGQKTETHIDKKHNDSEANTILYYYNNDDLLIKKTRLYNDGNLLEEFIIHYEQGNYDYMILSSKYGYNFENSCRSIGRFRTLYDKHENVIETSHPDETGIRADVKNRFYYDKNNRKVKYERINTKGELEITHIYIYE